MKLSTSWYSPRLEQDVTVARWGEVGTPVLVFPTAGGDAEEIERFKLVDAVAPLLESGRIKLYSCDSVAGRTWLRGERTYQHRAWIQNQFHQYVSHELVPYIRHDCKTPDLLVIAAGASIGAFNALAVLCRFPDAFSKAICMSGTYNLERFLEGPPTLDFYYASPHHFVPHLKAGSLDVLRHRFVVLASGEGRAEDIGESWRMARILGDKRIPNRVDSWGKDWVHDWPTWRNMLPKYLGELA